MFRQMKTSRKPIGSGSMDRPSYEYSVQSSQLSSSPYINARGSPSLPGSWDGITNTPEEFFDKRSSRESDVFFDSSSTRPRETKTSQRNSTPSAVSDLHSKDSWQFSDSDNEMSQRFSPRPESLNSTYSAKKLTTRQPAMDQPAKDQLPVDMQDFGATCVSPLRTHLSDTKQSADYSAGTTSVGTRAISDFSRSLRTTPLLNASTLVSGNGHRVAASSSNSTQSRGSSLEGAPTNSAANSRPTSLSGTAKTGPVLVKPNKVSKLTSDSALNSTLVNDNSKRHISNHSPQPLDSSQTDYTRLHSERLPLNHRVSSSTTISLPPEHELRPTEKNSSSSGEHSALCASDGDYLHNDSMYSYASTTREHMADYGNDSSQIQSYHEQFSDVSNDTAQFSGSGYYQEPSQQSSNRSSLLFDSGFGNPTIDQRYGQHHPSEAPLYFSQPGSELSLEKHEHSPREPYPLGYSGSHVVPASVLPYPDTAESSSSSYPNRPQWPSPLAHPQCSAVNASGQSLSQSAATDVAPSCGSGTSLARNGSTASTTDSSANVVDIRQATPSSINSYSSLRHQVPPLNSTNTSSWAPSPDQRSFNPAFASPSFHQPESHYQNIAPKPSFSKHPLTLKLTNLENNSSSSQLSPFSTAGHIMASSSNSYSTNTDSPMSIRALGSGNPLECTPISSPAVEQSSVPSSYSPKGAREISSTEQATASYPNSAPLSMVTTTDKSVPRTPVNTKTNAVLGIGQGSSYVRRLRGEAAETTTSRLPASLPLGLRRTTRKPPINVKPEFLRRAMDIRYTHLPQRMLQTEVDDDDGEDDDVAGSVRSGTGNRNNYASSISGSAYTATNNLAVSSVESPDHSTIISRPSSPAESIVEQVGKIKLFVANPDDE